MANRGLMGISLVSGLIAVIIFILVISAYAGSRGTAGPVAVQATPGQPVDSDLVYGAPNNGNATAAPAPTVQPVQPPQQAAAGGSQPVEAPPASAPANPFTAGIH